MSRQVYVDLAKTDLEESAGLFFRKLGPEFERQFADGNAKCTIVNENAFVMLLVMAEGGF